MRERGAEHKSVVQHVFVRLTQEGSLSKLPSICGGDQLTVVTLHSQVWAFAVVIYLM